MHHRARFPLPVPCALLLMRFHSGNEFLKYVPMYIYTNKAINIDVAFKRKI